jgi:hypothetical protein
MIMPRLELFLILLDSWPELGPCQLLTNVIKQFIGHFFATCALNEKLEIVNGPLSTMDRIVVVLLKEQGI